MTDWNELISDVVAGNWKDPSTGKTATVPFEVIRIEDDLDGGEADVLAPLKLGKRIAVVSDVNTHEAMGKRVAKHLKGLGTIEELTGDKALVRLTTGELIDATAVNAKEKGGKTLVSIRPERVEFKPEMMPPGAHTIDAEVVEIIYMGDILRAVLKVAGSDDFVMKMRNTLGQTKLSPGQKIKVGWHPQDARALDP